MRLDVWNRPVPGRAVPQTAATTSGPTAAGGRRLGSPAWIFAYAIIQFACQVALLTKELAPARVVFRSAVFGASLLFLFAVPGSSRSPHPVRTMALAIMTIVTLSAFNPEGGSPLAVAAHWAMYLSVLAPLFWVARLDIGEKTLRELMLVLWAFHTASAVVGVLQVYFPGQFQPALTTFITEKQAMVLRLASGEMVVRPTGLTGVPGGAASSGVYAALFGIGVVLTRPFPGSRILALLSMTAGMMCIYIAQVRSALVVLGVCFIVVVALLALSGRIPRAAWVLVLTGLVVIVGFDLAFDLGGEVMTNRLRTLVQYDPATVYRSNRGIMIEDAITNILPTYPLGVGLGQWGMVFLYFGSTEQKFGAEVQWVGWLLDGGFLLVLAYTATLLTMIGYTIRASVRAAPGDRNTWAAIITAYNVGVFALCFSYVPFMSAAGLEVWLLNAVLLQSEHGSSEARA
jgi:hypothetical protein